MNDENTHKMKDNNAEVGYAATKMETFTANDRTYQVVKVLSDTTGEAQVYLLEYNHVQYVLKLYYPNCTPKIKLLKLLSELDSRYIVRLYTYGFITMDSSPRCYELMEYLEGESLAEFKLEGNYKRFCDIAMAAARSLNVCHEKGIIHRDVKLANFFFRDADHENLVLADFGISSLAHNEDLHVTTQARTPIYAAPEMYMNVIDGEVELTAKIDYYSLGITLLCLWLGGNPFVGNERVLMQQKMDGKLPSVDDLPARINQLIRGLTIVNPEYRWGFNEVSSWYAGAEVPVSDDIPYLRYKRFVFDPDKDLIAKNAKELARLMKENRLLGIKYLYSKRIARWLEESGNQKLSVGVNDVVERDFPLDMESGLDAAIYLLDPEQPFLLYSSHPTHTPAAIVEAFQLNQYREQDFKALTDRRLLVWLFNKDEIELYNQISELVADKHHTKALAYGVLYTLNKDAGYLLGESTNRSAVGHILNQDLIRCQTIEKEEDYIVEFNDYFGEYERLYYYCLVRGWDDVLALRANCLDLLNHKNEIGWLGECDYPIVVYKFCAGLSSENTVGYHLPRSKQTISLPDDLSHYSETEVKREIRNGKLKEWLSVYFHEKPNEDYAEEYSREKALAGFLRLVEKYNPTDHYVKRFFLAAEKQEAQQQTLKKSIRSVQLADICCFALFLLLGGLFVFLFAQYGIKHTDYFTEHYFYAICAPIAVFGMMYFALKSYILSTGFIAGLFFTIFGSAAIVAPSLAAYWLIGRYPDEISRIILATGVLYLVLIFIFGLTKSSTKLNKLRSLYKYKVEYNIVEPLVFAYRTTVANYKCSDAKIVKEGYEIIRVTQRKLLTFYIIWLLLILLFLVAYIIYSPSLMGKQLPGLFEL